jgi:hypothetical protein
MRFELNCQVVMKMINLSTLIAIKNEVGKLLYVIIYMRNKAVGYGRGLGPQAPA